ncbi:MAG: hypothetical protein ABIU20_05005 [Blastocatellia bacterium]
MEKAAARCRNVYPKVRRVDAQTVTVYDSRGNAYTVRFAQQGQPTAADQEGK